MTVKALRMVMIVISLCALVVSGLFLAREYTQVTTLIHMGDMWSFLSLRDDSVAVFMEVDTRDFVEPPYPTRSDTLLTVNSLPATRENYFSVFNTETPPGTIASITYKSGDQTFSSHVRARAIPAVLRLQIVVLFALRSLFTTALIIVGFWAFTRRPDSPAVRVLTFLCYGLALSMLFSNQPISGSYAGFQLPRLVGWAVLAFALFAPAFWFKLQLLFPRMHPVYRVHRVLFNILIYAAPVALSTYALFIQRLPGLLPRVYSTIFFAFGFALLGWNYRKAMSFIERRQTRLMLLGSIPGLGMFIIHAWTIALAGAWFRGLSSSIKLAVLNVESLLLLLIPLLFAIALGRYRLLEVEGRMKRGTRLLAVNVFLLVVMFVLLYSLGELLLMNMGVDSRTPTIALILILALGFAPAERKIRRIIEDRIYPERVRLQALLSEFLQGRRHSELGRGFWKELEGKLLTGIGAERIYPVLLRGRNEAWCADECDLVPFELSDEFLSLIGASGHPLLVDEIVASRKIALDRDLKDWLDARDVAVIVPLSTQRELIGLLLLTAKKNGEDYTHEELRLLDSLAAQIAIVAENVELLEDKLEKQRLEEQLEIARHVQEGLLPKSLPHVQNLELAAKIRFCLDVAGDYYDVIPQGNGSALLAVGDVSGKGVGPALLMANLQAALRAVKDIGRPFRDVMSNINAHVHENTSPELFITLFVTLVEPEAGKICFINAGHNAPILLRRNGEVERLGSTGLLLGFLPEAEYREQTIELNRGDTLLMFTDGVSEAMNGTNDEFGEERIVDIMREYRDLPLSQLLDTIEEQVRFFRGQESFDDDFTLLAARVTADSSRS